MENEYDKKEGNHPPELNRANAWIRERAESGDQKLTHIAYALEPMHKWWRKSPWLLRKATLTIPYKCLDGAMNLIGFDLPDIADIADKITSFF